MIFIINLQDFSMKYRQIAIYNSQGGSLFHLQTTA